jgi:hypothetical protein
MKAKHLTVAFAIAALMTGLPGHRADAQQRKSESNRVEEVRELLTHLQVEKPRRHKAMIVFPLRYSGKQAPGEWETMSQALKGNRLKVRELPNATVPEVEVENTGDKTVFLLSGEIIAGGKQTRTIRKDTIVEPKQIVKVPVFCIEHGRWTGHREFHTSSNYLPSTLNSAIKAGAAQGEVWHDVAARAARIEAPSATSSLDEILNSEQVQEGFRQAHKDLGKFSPPDTVGIAVADAYTGRVVGIELFGRRDLFEELQDKLIEGYAADIVLARPVADEKEAREIGEKDVQDFIARILSLEVRYEDTPGSGRGIDLSSGALNGKGVALGDHVIHLSIQEMVRKIQPVRPIVTDPPTERYRVMPH